MNRVIHFVLISIVCGSGILPATLKAQVCPQQPNDAHPYTYWLTIPPNEIPPYNVSDLDVYVSSEYDTEMTVLDVSTQTSYRRKITAGETRTLSADRGETNWTWEVREYEVPTPKGIRITADRPLSIAVLNSKTFTTDGYQAIPVEDWGTEYIVSAYYDYGENRPWGGGFCVLAAEDSTVINITLRGVGNATHRTMGGRKLGDKISVVLQSGEVYCVQGDGTTRNEFDLTGSLITSSKPVGVWGYQQRTTVPNALPTASRDHLVSMLFPVDQWSTHYSTVGFSRQGTNNGGSGDLIRIVGAEPNTEWTLKYYDKEKKNLIRQHSGILVNSGDFAEISNASQPSELPRDFIVCTATKPIQVVQYSTSANFDGDQIHDPFMIALPGVNHFVSNAFAQNPTSSDFNITLLNLVVWADTADPNYVENLKSIKVNGTPVWNHPQSQQPSLLSNHMGDNFHWAIIEHGQEASPRMITSNGHVRFSGYLYGFGRWNSFGWPIDVFGGNNTRDSLKALDREPPTLVMTDSTRVRFRFTATELSNTPDPPREVALRGDQIDTGLALINVRDLIGNNNLELKLITDSELPESETYKSFDFEVLINDSLMDASGLVTVSDWAGNCTFDTVYAPGLLIEPDSSFVWDFGKRRLNDSLKQTQEFTNKSMGGDTLLGATLRNGAHYSVVPTIPQEGVYIVSGGSYNIQVLYLANRETTDPSSDFDLDTLDIQFTRGTLSIPVIGITGTPTLQVADIDFGMVNAGDSACNREFVLENIGGDDLVITGIRGYTGTQFGIKSLPSDIFPKTIPARTQWVPGITCFKPLSNEPDVITVEISTEFTSGSDTSSLWYANGAVSVEDHYNGQKSPFNVMINNGTLTIEAPGLHIENVKLVDLQGKGIAQMHVDGQRSTIALPVDHLASGAYVVVLETQDITLVRMVSISR